MYILSNKYFSMYIVEEYEWFKFSDFRDTKTSVSRILCIPVHEHSRIVSVITSKYYIPEQYTPCRLQNVIDKITALKEATVDGKVVIWHIADDQATS